VRKISCSVVLFWPLWPLFIAGCDGSSAEESSGSKGTTAADGGHPQLPRCELASRTELADENEVAPNGQTGAKILAAVPDALHTSLHWDFSSSVTGVEVEVPGSSGLSSVLDLTFSFPPEHRFFFEDRIVVRPDGDYQVDIELVCDDYVTTVLDVNIMTEDGTISLNLTGLTVRLGPDRPDYDDVAKPLIYETVAMTTPVVNFLKPEALPANTDKAIAMEFDFDGVSVEGTIMVYAEGTAGTYEHLVARW
jgi:hypothetical protein